MALTVSALDALTPGDKLTPGNAVHIRRNADDTLSVTLRVKRGGVQHDLKAGSFPAPFSKATLAAIAKATAEVRENADDIIASKARRSTPQAEGEALTKHSTLGAVYADFLADVVANGKWSPRNHKASADRVNKHLKPWPMWSRPASATTPADVKRLLSQLSKTPAQQKKIKGLLGLAFTHAMELKHVEANPVDPAVRMLRNTSKADEGPTHHHALEDIKELRKLYKAIDQLAGSPSIRNCLRLQALTAQRTGECIGATWDEFDLDSEAPTWTLPRSRMKIKSAKRGPHVLILSRQCAEFLRTLPRNGDHLFPGRAGEGRSVPHITDNSISQAMRRDLSMQDIHTPHGWRASLRTLGTSATNADGLPLFAESWLEAVLDHQPAKKVTAAYQRGQQKMVGVVLQWWADQLMNS